MIHILGTVFDDIVVGSRFKNIRYGSSNPCLIRKSCGGIENILSAPILEQFIRPSKLTVHALTGIDFVYKPKACISPDINFFVHLVYKRQPASVIFEHLPESAESRTSFTSQDFSFSSGVVIEEVTSKVTKNTGVHDTLLIAYEDTIHSELLHRLYKHKNFDHVLVDSCLFDISNTVIGFLNASNENLNGTELILSLSYETISDKQIMSLAHQSCTVLLHCPTHVDIYRNGILSSVRNDYYIHNYKGKTNGLGDMFCALVAVFLDRRLGLVESVKKAQSALSQLLLNQG